MSRSELYIESIMKIALYIRDLRRYSGGGVSLYIHKIINYLLNETEALLLLFCRHDLSFGDIKLDDRFSSRITLINLETEGSGASQDIPIPTLLTVHDIIPFFIREGPVLEEDKFNWYKKLITS